MLNQLGLGVGVLPCRRVGLELAWLLGDVALGCTLVCRVDFVGCW